MFPSPAFQSDAVQ